MIVFRDVYTTESEGERELAVLRGLSFEVSPTARFGLLVRSPEIRRHIVQVLAGMRRPTAGTVHGATGASYPVGYTAGLNPKLSLSDNATMVAALYGADRKGVHRILTWVFGEGSLRTELSEVGVSLRTQFAYCLSYAIPFSIYVADTAAIPNASIVSTRMSSLINERLETSALFLVSGSPYMIRASCRTAGILTADGIRMYDTANAAIRDFGDM